MSLPIPAFLRPLLRLLATPARHTLYRLRAAFGRPAGSAHYAFDPPPEADPWCLEVRIPEGIDPAEARAFAEHQTLRELRLGGSYAEGPNRESEEAQTDEPGSAPTRFLYLPAPDEHGALPELYPAFLESAVLVLSAQDLDAVVLGERLAPELDPGSAAELFADDARGRSLRCRTVFRADAITISSDGSPTAVADPFRVLVIGRHGVIEPDSPFAERTPERRGSYLSSRDWGPNARLGLRDAAHLPRTAIDPRDPRPAVLVLAPFLARGGAEHTLFETLWALRHRFRFDFATLAPHRPELGDRRSGFEALSPRLFCLGDLVHPAAMVGMLHSILDASGAEILYNANGSTLFYDFAPRLAAERPGLRILDHLYDHRVGYIERYRDPALEKAVHAVVAENHPVARALIDEYAWPADRAPIVWPCGRPADAFPAEAERRATRDRVRRQLGYTDDAVIVLTAARMHSQKRPTDLARLAHRVRDLEELHFLVVGGGDLEAEMDRAVVEASADGARIARLGFRTDIPDLILAADVGCLVSEYEGLPVFLLECLQAGRPFLGTEVGDLGHVLRHSGAGWVVDRPGDLDALEAAARELVDARKRAEKAERALAAAARFAPEACAERYAEVFLGRDPGPEELG